METSHNILKELGFSPKSETFPIPKGGSMRSFFRFDDAKFGACVCCIYSEEKAENFLYAQIAQFLKDSRVGVPQIYAHSKKLHTLVMEDVGELDLLDFAKSANTSELENAYKKALIEVIKIHDNASCNFLKNPIELMSKFDISLYVWERNYFWDNLICEHLKMQITPPQIEWHELTCNLLNAPQCLLHRDFQSQNTILSADKSQVKLIDFQGMREGVCWYDLGSLLFDPYANLSASLRNSLYEFYCNARELDSEKSRQIFYQSSAQRLMQALGAFAYLSNKKGKVEYLNYIEPALENLKICAQCGELAMTFEIAQAAQKTLALSKNF